MDSKVLIVEDNAINRNTLVKILSDEYDTLEAENGKVAWEILQKEYQSLSAVILDILMPEMNGKELLQLISKEEKYANLPILIATGEHDSKLESECLRLGAWDFVVKPYNPSVLKLRLRNIVGRSQSYLLRQVQLLAERDPLTQIYNRQYFFESMSKLLQNNPQEKFALIRMDIDNFSLYNSAYGSKNGNILLKKMAAGIEMLLKKKAIKKHAYGHIVSDIFCICIPYEKEQAEQMMNCIADAVQEYSSAYRLKVSFGIYVIDDIHEDLEEIYSHTADAARLCKNNMNRLFAYYTEEMGEKELRAQAFTNEIGQAIKEEQFQIYLQPKYSIETGKPCGAEALVRWFHPQWGMVSPGDFIPVFEKNGLVVQLDYYMWEHVCMLLKKWQDAGRKVFPISVNMSRVSLYNPKVVEDIVTLTEKYQIPRYMLNLEITESAYMSNQDMMKQIIDRFHENGFVILMDDFGSGYSSLNTLKDIDVDILKIDMKFLPTGQNNTKSEKILASVARMAGWLGMPVVVEGVETKEQRDFLESIGCTYVQGYYYARPMPVEAYEKGIDEEEDLFAGSEKDTEDIRNDFDMLFSADSSTGTLLRSVSVPYAIIEYGNSHVDLLRTNQKYMEEFGNHTLEHYLLQKENYKLTAALDEAVITKKKATCECLFIMQDGKSKWYQIHMVYIGTCRKTSLISATFTDVTMERTLEKELHSVFLAIRDSDKKKSSMLVIDDQEMSREIAVSLFEDDYEILQAADGQEGLKILEEKSEQIAVILLDMLMPKMDGREFLFYKNRMEKAADIPIVVISSEADEALQTHMLENGVNDYVTKPFVPAVMKKRLSNVLEYNSRFRTLVREFHEASAVPLLDDGNINLEDTYG